MRAARHSLAVLRRCLANLHTRPPPISAAEAKACLLNEGPCLSEVAQLLSPSHREALAAVLVAKATQDSSPPPEDKRYEGMDLLSTTFLLYLPNRPPLNPALSRLGVMEPLTSNQSLNLFLFNFIPFIGFGIMDNTIMLTCGDYIDSAIGERFGITTLAAAALGNCVSNGLGFATSDAVQKVVWMSGLRSPHLTEEQEHAPFVTNLRLAAQILGMVVGCLIGMFPLLFKKDRPALCAGLAALSEDDQARVMPLLIEGRYDVGDRLIRAGEPVSWVYFLEEGHVDVIGADASGIPTLLAELGPGSAVGSLEVSLGRPARIDAVARDAVVAQRLHVSDFARFFGAVPPRTLALPPLAAHYDLIGP